MPSAQDIDIATPTSLASMPATGGVPRWLRGGTVYGAIVERIGNGAFHDLIDRLDDLADLGVAALWLAPITETLPGCFGYEVVDYLQPRAAYGTRDAFRDLVRQAHARDIRVLLDVAPNHTSVAHPWYVAAETGGPSHPRHDWYDRDESRTATHYFDWTHLPNLNFDHADVRQAMTDAMLSWVRECDVDGFRIDVAWGIRQRRPDFWAGFAGAFRTLKPDGVLIAEASAHDAYYLANGFDLVYDWTADLGHWAWQDVFSSEISIPDALRAAVTAAIEGAYNPTTQTFRFLNNNDTGTRFISRHGAGMYRAALATLMTLPGVPCLYLGDEVGAAFEPYGPAAPVGREDPHGLRPFVRRLVGLRRAMLDTGAVSWAWLGTGPHDTTMAWSITGGNPAVIVINWTDRAMTVRLRETDIANVFPRGVEISDRISGQHIDITSGILDLGAWGVAMLVGGEARQ
jgi:glycosidase